MKHLFEAVPQMRTVISSAARYLPFLWLSLHKVKLSRFLPLDNVESLSPSSAPGLTPARVSVSVALRFPALLLCPSLARPALRTSWIWPHALSWGGFGTSFVAEAFKAEVASWAIFFVLAADVNLVVVDVVELWQWCTCSSVGLPDPIEDFGVADVGVVVWHLSSAI